MAYYAKLLNNNVIDVMIADDDYMKTFVDSSPGKWLLASKRVKRGIYHEKDGSIPSDQATKIAQDAGTKRKNFPSKGYTYDPVRDAFIRPSPFPSWKLNDTSCDWEAPTAQPDDGSLYRWDEDNTKWVKYA